MMDKEDAEAERDEARAEVKFLTQELDMYEEEACGSEDDARKDAATIVTLRTQLGELLAVIHRDGGHKQDELGLDKAVELAMHVSVERVARLVEAVGVLRLWERYDTSDMTDVDCMLAYADAIGANRAFLAQHKESEP